MYFIHLELSLSLTLFTPWINPIIDSAKDIKMGIIIIANTKTLVTTASLAKININKNISRKSRIVFRVLWEKKIHSIA